MSEYGNRDTVNQGAEYIKHVSAMTGEGLHDKSDIAAELAHRDIQIQQLRKQLEQAEADKRELFDGLEMLFDHAGQFLGDCSDEDAAIFEDALSYDTSQLIKKHGGQK